MVRLGTLDTFSNRSWVDVSYLVHCRHDRGISESWKLKVNVEAAVNLHLDVGLAVSATEP